MKVCHYEILGLERKCKEEDIKRAYRRLALKQHPDKASLNGLSCEEATQKFQVLEEAYSVLSDPQQRAWYDNHREQILSGDGEKKQVDPLFNLQKFFSSSCFNGFGNCDKGFYSVYRELFEKIQKGEDECSEDSDTAEPISDMPRFGDSESPWAEVSAFYRSWLDFTSCKSFSCADKWNPNTAENRQEKRAMVSENKKARCAARKAFNKNIRELASFVQDRDPRITEHLKAQAEAEARQKSETEASRKREAEEKQRQKVERQRRLAPVAMLPR